jgi:hypothetical protein
MLSTRIPTAIVALVAAGSIAAGSLAPQAGAATKGVTAASPAATQISLATRQISAAAPTNTFKDELTVAIWTTKYGTGQAMCIYPDGAVASEGEEATVMVFLDNGTVISYKIVCTREGWRGA